LRFGGIGNEENSSRTGSLARLGNGKTDPPTEKVEGIEPLRARHFLKVRVTQV
jgi:hypothetical protein